jgi:hypothetical protein
MAGIAMSRVTSSLTGEGPLFAGPSGDWKEEETSRRGERVALAVEVTTRIGKELKDGVCLHADLRCCLRRRYASIDWAGADQFNRELKQTVSRTDPQRGQSITPST